MPGSDPKPPLPRDVAQRARFRVFAALAAAFAGAAVLYFFNPVSTWFYPACYLHQTTGLLCPGCGSLRAMHQLLHGNLAGAFGLNPLLVLSLPVALAVGCRQVLRTLQGRDAALNIRPAWLWAGLVVLVVFFVARNLPTTLVQLHS